jgi:steroid delta-isomerase-like uncharacterized protein
MKKLIYSILVAGIIASCNMPDNSANEKAAKNEARMREFYDQVFNAHNVTMVDSFLTEDFIEHQPAPGQGPGLAGLKASLTEFFTAYPDVHANVNFMMTKGDTVLAHIKLTGTNSGPLMGNPPTNKSISLEGVDIVVIKDGKATEHWGFSEEMKMMTQLGMMPEPGATHDPAMAMGDEKK